MRTARAPRPRGWPSPARCALSRISPDLAGSRRISPDLAVSRQVSPTLRSKLLTCTVSPTQDGTRLVGQAAKNQVRDLPISPHISPCNLPTSPPSSALSPLVTTRASMVHQAAANPSNTVNDAKRLIGRSYLDSGLQQDIKHVSYTVKEVRDLATSTQPQLPWPPSHTPRVALPVLSPPHCLYSRNGLACPRNGLACTLVTAFFGLS